MNRTNTSNGLWSCGSVTASMAYSTHIMQDTKKLIIIIEVYCEYIIGDLGPSISHWLLEADGRSYRVKHYKVV